MVNENEENLMDKLNRLRKEKDAFIPAHYYQPEEIKLVADFVGDSLELSKKSRETKKNTILFAGVKFMAETAKILNPDKTVLISSLEAGCSLADSITAEDVRNLRREYPEAAVVCYINTTAEVKAESDICCTSANYMKIIESLPNRQIIFVPDVYMANNIKGKTKKEIIGWCGECVVHKNFSPEQVGVYKKLLPDVQVIVHIECPPKVTGGADFVGSTSGMRRFIESSKYSDFLVMTECGMLPTLEKEFPDKKFHTPCTICPYMKKISLEGLVWSLETGKNKIKIPENVREKAKDCLEKMLQFS